MCPERLVHHRERVGGQRVLSREHGQQHRVAGLQPAAAAQRSRDHDVGLGIVIKPSGSRRAVTTPAAAVRVSRSPGLPAQRAGHGAVSGSRPEASIRPNPYSTSSGAAGITGTTATGSVRAVPALPRPRADDRPDGGIEGR